MTSPALKPGDLFNSQTVPIPNRIVLEVKGIVPSFKTQKTAYGWKDKATGKIFARPATLPEHKEWMRKTVLSFVSQLRSDFQISASATPMDATLRSLIASLPPDDTWTAIPESSQTSRLCEPGEEPGATIVIERLP
jgi:hypothetical protein